MTALAASAPVRDWTGTAVSVGLHAALLAALSLSLAHGARIPEPPAMEVSFVDEVALEASSPSAAASAPPAADAPVLVPEPDAPAPTAAPRPAPTAAPAPSRAAVEPARNVPLIGRTADRPTARGGADPLAAAPDDDLAPRRGTAPAAATFDTRARASIGQAILAQVRPCADRQPYLGEGANQVRLTVNLRLSRSGRLTSPPRIVAMAGDGGLKARYGDLLEDQVTRIFTQCSPLRLPADLYDTPSGGWGDFTFNYRVQ